MTRPARMGPALPEVVSMAQGRRGRAVTETPARTARVLELRRAEAAELRRRLDEAESAIVTLEGRLVAQGVVEAPASRTPFLDYGDTPEGRRR